MEAKFLPLTATNYQSTELSLVQEAILSQRLEGNGAYSKKVHQFFTQQYQFKHNFFTPSGTDALELAALVLRLGPQDEVLVPSYTFPSTAHAFALRGCQIVLVDSQSHHPNLDLDDLESKITSKTKAICVVHYGGASVDMNRLKKIVQEHQLYLIEDAAQAIDAYYAGQPLGGWGDLGAFSFHQTKNISAGEGGLLVTQSHQLAELAEIIREKGTNRASFIRGDVDKYTCVDIGSSFVGSDLNAALLLAQLGRLTELQNNRLAIWKRYQDSFTEIDVLQPIIEKECQHNGHNYFFVFSDSQQRDHFMTYLKQHQIGAVFHYVGLHMGAYYQARATYTALPNSEFYTNGLVRLPLYAGLSEVDQNRIIEAVVTYFKKYRL